MPGKYAALVLSRGEQFQPPPLIPIAHGYSQWPEDSQVFTRFYDSAGGMITEIFGETTTDAITFDSPPEDVDMVPQGAGFETFLVDDDSNIKQIRYGQVIRREAQFFNAPSSDTSNLALQFRDNFYNRTGRVGSKWFVTRGRPTIFDNSPFGSGNPNGVGPNFIFFTDAAMRFFAPLNTDSFMVSFNLLNPGAGKTGIVLASNAAMTSYLYVMFESGISNNRLHMGFGEGPISMIDQVPTVNHTVVNNTNYKLRYDDFTKKVALLNSTMTTELISWTDTGAIVPHGQGYRYFGANWQASLLSSGVQLTSISAQDGFDA